MNTYTPDELTRIEILGYNNPEGLHPVEANWRNLARKLLEDLKETEVALSKHHHKVPADSKCFDCGQRKMPRVWPEVFKPKDNNLFTNR